MRKKVIILGGGLSGLAAARFLSKRNFYVTILEKEAELGGLAGSFRQENYWIPNYYHHVISHNDTTQRYLNRYNLLKDAIWKKIKIVIASKNKITDISNPYELLRFDTMSMIGRIRFGLFGLYMLFVANPDKLKDDLDARSWLLKVGGKEVTNIVFNNLYARNKFNLDLSRISAKQLAWRLKEREVYDPFTYPLEGLQELINNVEREVKKLGGKIKRETEITKIDLESKEVIVNKKRYKGDMIINTIPIPEFLKVCKKLPKDYERKLRRVKYCPAVCIAFGTEDYLDKRYYWINVLGERVHTIFQHSILCDRYPWKVNWVLRYGGSEEDLNLSDKEIGSEYLSVVKKYFPKTRVVWLKVIKTKYGEPIYDSDYSRYMPRYRTPIKGFYNAGIQVSFPKIRNMNSALESGERVAEIIVKDIRKKRI
jgi:protoporphyrinogen oxidase